MKGNAISIAKGAGWIGASESIVGPNIREGGRYRTGSLYLSGWLVLMAALVFLGVSIYYTWVIVPLGAASRGRRVVPDLYPAWYACRIVLLQRTSPYTPQVTADIQRGMYGHELQAGSNLDQQRFAYPLYSTLLFAPTAWMSFPEAQAAYLVLFVSSTWIALSCWLPPFLSKVEKIAWRIFAIAGFPFLMGLQLRQPTMLVFALLSAVIVCIRNNSLRMAGIALALATIKPQLALPMAIPILFWSFAEWHERKRLVIWLTITEAVLFAASEIMVRGWVSGWLQTLRAYPHYAGAKSLVFLHLGTAGNTLMSLLCAVAAIAVACKWSRRDLPFALAFSVASFQLVFPLQLYNEVCLIIPVMWLIAHDASWDRGLMVRRLSTLCLLGVGLASTASTIAVVGLYRIAPLSLVKSWTLPAIPIYLLPSIVFVLLGFYALRALWDETHDSIAKHLSSPAGRPALVSRALQLTSNSGGQSLVETAVAIPILALMLCFAVDTGYYFYVAANLTTSAKVAAEYGAQGYSSPGQLQLPAAGPITSATTQSFLAIGDIAGLQSASTTATVAICSKTIGINGNLTKCSTYGSGTQQYTPDADPEAPMFTLGRVDVLYVVNPPIPLNFFSLTVMPPLTLHRSLEFRTVD